jgi:hypothetical protein
MADIAKCSGEGCPLKDMCYRFTAPANEYRQSYFSTPPIKDNKCEMFWGESSEYLMQYLQDIVDGKKTLKK